MSTGDGPGGRPRVGCYPGSFGPLTVAHLAVADAARRFGSLDRVDLVLSVDALGRAGDDGLPSVEERVAVLQEVAASRSWLGVVLRRERLIVDLAEGYDAVVLGADKWRQVLDPRWYGGEVAERDRALARLPLVLVAPRADDDLSDLTEPTAPTAPTAPQVRVVPVDEVHRHVGATAIRVGDASARRWLAEDPAVHRAADRWFGPHPT